MIWFHTYGYLRWYLTWYHQNQFWYIIWPNVPFPKQKILLVKQAKNHKRKVVFQSSSAADSGGIASISFQSIKLQSKYSTVYIYNSFFQAVSICCINVWHRCMHFSQFDCKWMSSVRFVTCIRPQWPVDVSYKDPREFVSTWWVLGLGNRWTWKGERTNPYQNSSEPDV